MHGNIDGLRGEEGSGTKSERQGVAADLLDTVTECGGDGIEDLVDARGAVRMPPVVIPGSMASSGRQAVIVPLRRKALGEEGKAASQLSASGCDSLGGRDS